MSKNSENKSRPYKISTSKSNLPYIALSAAAGIVLSGVAFAVIPAFGAFTIAKVGGIGGAIAISTGFTALCSFGGYKLGNKINSKQALAEWELENNQRENRRDISFEGSTLDQNLDSFIGNEGDTQHNTNNVASIINQTDDLDLTETEFKRPSAEPSSPHSPQKVRLHLQK